jgi:hypothetical protein
MARRAAIDMYRKTVSTLAKVLSMRFTDYLLI